MEQVGGQLLGIAGDAGGPMVAAGGTSGLLVGFWEAIGKNWHKSI